MLDKVTKKELKEPDFLQVAFRKTITLIVRHKTKLYIILTLLVLGVAITLGLHLYRLNYNKAALLIYNQVEETLLRNSTTDTAKIIDGYKNVVSKYPASQSALHALYKLGNIYFSTNQIDSSLKSYDEFLKKVSRDDYLKIFALTGKGYCYEAKKDFKNALVSFDAALKISGATMFEGQLHRDLGRIYEEMKDRKKSLEHYRKSLEKTTDPTMEMLIKRKIAELA